MDIDLLRKIGSRLYREISKYKFSKTPVGKGASGDTTYSIDKIAEDIIVEEIEKEGVFNLITEEKGFKLTGSSETVIVDPIDGSKNAISGIPFFSTSIAIADGGSLENLKLGYILNLINGDEFWAERGKGAYRNSERIKTQKGAQPLVIAFESSSPYIDLQKIIPIFKFAYRVRCFGSTALDLAYLSSGALTVFITASTSRIFDFSAGILILKEAGGIVTDLEGKSLSNLPIKFDTKATLLACSDEETHKRIFEVINKN
ncbi:MAG: hypothetical protein NZ845_01250 [Thermodesulfovibrio sp.]|nr:hypothetical protein [Thermodesulfovibrio sp.]